MSDKKNRSFIVAFGLLGSLASIIALIIIFIPRAKSLELSVTTSLIESLTDNQLNDPNLKAHYFYKGDTINNLWKVVVELENKSDESFVISEHVRNILEDTLRFTLSDNVKLIDTKQIIDDFPNKKFILNNGQHFGISFKQWRPYETTKYFMYVQTNDSLNLSSNIFKDAIERPIIDGDIRYYHENETNKESEKSSFIPNSLRMIAYVLIIVGFGIFTIAFVALFFGSIIGFYMRKKWRVNEMADYNEFINEYYKDDEKNRTECVGNPNKFIYWTKYDGVPYPELDAEYSIEKGISLFFAELFTLISIAVMLIVIFDLIRFFP